MDAVEALEARLADQLGRRFCIATGRGASAIWIGLQALGGAGRTVVLPATLCTSPAAVTRLAGFEPLFCDVEPLTGNLDPQALSQLIDGRDDIACVIAAHLYGQPAKIVEIETLCQARRIPLMEDAAQALGAAINGGPAGGFGDLSIVSFGHTKILDVGGGGAVLTNDAELAGRLRNLASALPAPPSELGVWSTEYRNAYYSLLPDIKTGAQSAEQIGKLCLRHPRLYHYGITQESAEHALAALPGLPAELAHRRAMAALWREALTGSDVTFMDEQTGGAPWRFNVLISGGRRDAVADALRAEGFDASPWYPVVAPFFEQAPDYRERSPGAARIEQEILNLWVDHSVTETRIRSACAVIRRSL